MNGRQKMILRRAEARSRLAAMPTYPKSETRPDGLLTWRETQALLRDGFGPLEEQASEAYEYLMNDVGEDRTPENSRFYALVTEDRPMRDVVLGLTYVGMKFQIKKL